MGDASGLPPLPQFRALRTFHETHFVLKVSEFSAVTQRAVCNGCASFVISLAASSKKRGCGNKMHNTLRCASEIVSGHIYWGFGAQKINSGYQ
jgi:hypothetical protein